MRKKGTLRVLLSGEKEGKRVLTKKIEGEASPTPIVQGGGGEGGACALMEGPALACRTVEGRVRGETGRARPLTSVGGKGKGRRGGKGLLRAVQTCNPCGRGGLCVS